jgi:hypothetical protein
MENRYCTIYNKYHAKMENRYCTMYNKYHCEVRSNPDDIQGIMVVLQARNDEDKKFQSSNF